MNGFIYLQQVGNVFYSEETWRDLPLKKVKFFVVLFSYFRLEEKQKFKNQSASQWVQLRGRKTGFFKEALFFSTKKLCEFFTTEGSLQSHLGVVFDMKNNGTGNRKEDKGCNNNSSYPYLLHLIFIYLSVMAKYEELLFGT